MFVTVTVMNWELSEISMLTLIMSLSLSPKKCLSEPAGQSPFLSPAITYFPGLRWAAGQLSAARPAAETGQLQEARSWAGRARGAGRDAGRGAGRAQPSLAAGMGWGCQVTPVAAGPGKGGSGIRSSRFGWFS